MRAAIYNPYLDTLGGGERYCMAVAACLVELGYGVDVEWRNDLIKRILENRFGMNLEKVNFVPDVKRGDDYDVCFWVSDGSIPMLRARTNLLHFQVPFQKVGGVSLINKMKLYRVKKVVCNSSFTKKFIDKEYDVESTVLYPPVDIEAFKPKRKENLIVYVGRFSSLQQAKRQDVLVESFKVFYDSGMKNWRMILAGGTEVGGGDDYVSKLQKASRGYPVTILKGPGFAKIQEILGKAKIFWSAAGFGIDEENHPESVEHFGITPVEGMAAGAIPLLYNAGGHKEIVEDGRNGYLWREVHQLLDYTRELSKNEQKYKYLLKNAQSSSKKYSYDRFKKEFNTLLK